MSAAGKTAKSSQGRRAGRRRPPDRGMTLIELLVGVAIAAVVMLALVGLYIAGQRYFFNQGSRTDAIEEVRVPMAQISRDIREASNVLNGPVTLFNGQEYTTSEACLVLEVPSIDGAGLAIPGSTDYIVYAFDATARRLLRIISANGGVRPDRVVNLADNIVDDGSGGSPFKLRYYRSDGSTEVTSNYGDATNGAFIVEVELTAQGRSLQRGGKPFVETVRTQAKLRNKVVPG